jgi:hypothetical protein
LKISTSIKSNKYTLSAKSIDESIFEDIFESSSNTNHITLNDVKNMSSDLIDITNSNDFITTQHEQSKSLKSGSTCSSRTSYTNDNELDSMNENENNYNEDDNETTVNTNSDSNYYSANESDQEVDEENEEEDDEKSEYESTDEEETLNLTFPKFPVQVICMEKCDNTFDNLIMNEELSDDEWFSAFMQIIMILITYQKTFSLTHNDLHTNNIMYVSTNKKFLYYIYKKKTYKVPTFGKIYKIIDFGRAIYKFNGKIFCSDSFQTGGDAATQYNTEPYFNDTKPRLEPNFSFDLCRLACSIFDYVVDDFETIKSINDCSPLVKLIIEWCVDDNGINILYKNNGVERYPDFKLYKMIARLVHKHIPSDQLERPEFRKYVILNKNIPKNEDFINIDELPCYC